MLGIDLNKKISFSHASMRYFAENECHITRYCRKDVLLLVYDGVLRFSEDGKEYEIHPGEYHIQKHDSYQTGEIPSDSPKYLYVHFRAKWDDNDLVLPYRGKFDYKKLRRDMEELDRITHNNEILIKKSILFYKILMSLYPNEKEPELADMISDYIDKADLDELTLDMICRKFNFSKNHIINIFKKKYNVTPGKYINSVKIKRAMHMLEATSETIEEIAFKCGFNDYSHFYKVFCKENDISPAEWRKEMQLEPSFVFEHMKTEN